MRLFKRLILKRLLKKLEEKVAEEVMREHWPAVEETLRAEFGGACLEVALRAGRRACQRLVEHIL